MRFLEEKVLTEREVEDRSSAVLSCFISSLEDREWQSVQDRMMEPVSQTHLAQVSRRIIRVVSQLVLQLLAPALNVQLQPEDESRESTSESDEEPQRDGSRLQLEVESFLDVLEKDNSDEDRMKKRKNIVHFFQKLPKKTRNKWRKLTNRRDVYSRPPPGLRSLRKRRVVHFSQTLPDKIVKSIWVYKPTHWQTQALSPI